MKPTATASNRIAGGPGNGASCIAIAPSIASREDRFHQSSRPAAHESAGAAQALGIPKKDSFGSPIDVGLLILGHSTSAVGEYPAKLTQALNANANDGRNYVVFRVITGGEGGFLWTQLSFQPNDPQYARVQTSQSQQQWRQDNAGARWSCRRARLEEGLTGVKPPSCFNGTSCSPPATISLTWHEGGLEQTGTLSFHEAWKKMDVRLALIQDTSNRSWPVDDFNGDGAVDEKDYWPESRITAAAQPCGGTSGVVTDSGGARFIDWNCDGQLTAADSAVNPLWLETPMSICCRLSCVNAGRRCSMKKMSRSAQS